MSVSLSIIALLSLQSSSELPVTENAKVVQDVTACRAIEDAEDRLACFDAASQSLEAATESKEVVVVERAEVEKTKRKRFGLSIPDFGIFSRSDDDATRVDQVDSTLTSAKPFGYRRWEFALADGSVWETIETSSRLRPRKGDTIQIERAALGSFLATIDDSPAVRVRRVR